MPGPTSAYQWQADPGPGESSRTLGWILQTRAVLPLQSWERPPTTLSLCLGPRRPGAHLSCLLLKFLDSPLVDAPTFVDEVARGGRLARVHVANDYDVDVSLLLPHPVRGSVGGRGGSGGTQR